MYLPAWFLLKSLYYQKVYSFYQLKSVVLISSDVVKTLMISSQDPDGRDRDLEKIQVQDPRPRPEKIFETEIETR